MPSRRQMVQIHHQLQILRPCQQNVQRGELTDHPDRRKNRAGADVQVDAVEDGLVPVRLPQPEGCKS
jgi:hypothetical protein